MFLCSTAICMGVAQYLAHRRCLVAEKKMYTLIDEENEALKDKGLKWYLPKNSEMIELQMNYNLFVNKLAPKKSALNDDDEIAYKTYNSGWKYRNAPALNDDF